MGKLNVNSRIHKYSLIGKVEEHDLKINQYVLDISDVVFNNITTTEDLTVGGDLTVQGSLTTIHTNTLEVQDNIIEINSLETGAGVTSNLSGIEIERGTLTNHRLVFQETDDTWRLGEIGSTQAIATREDSPLINGIMTWNNTEQRLDSSNQIDIDIIYAGSNPTSKSTGGIRLTGGIGIENDAYIGGTLYFEGTSPTHATLTSDAANNFLIVSQADINLIAGTGGDINVPANVGMTFASDTQKIESNATDLTISSGTDLNLTATQDVNIPTDVGLTFSNDNFKIESDGSILTIEGTQIDINSPILNLSGSVSLETTDLINGIQIAVQNSGVPVTIGHTTSLTIIGDNLKVNGDLEVEGSSTFDGPLLIDETNTNALLVRKDLESGDVFRVDSATNMIYMINDSGFIGDKVVLNFELNDSGSNKELYAVIENEIIDNTPTNEDGSLTLKAVNNGTMKSYLSLNGNTDTIDIPVNTNVNLGTFSLGSDGTNLNVTADNTKINGGSFDITGAISGTPSTTGQYLQLSGNTFTDNATASSSVTSSMVFHSIGQPTLAATNTNVSTTTASTFYIDGAPITGTNQTITNPYAFWVGSGNSLFDGDITVNGTINGATLVGVTIEGTQVIDDTNVEAFLVRKNGDTGDIFTVDTLTPQVKVDSANLLVTHTFNGGAESGILNKDPGSNAFAEFRLENDGLPATVLFMNSSGKTTDGGVNTATLRNEAGTLRLQGNGSAGIVISTSEIVTDLPTNIDITNTNAFVVRKDADGGDVLIIDTFNDIVSVVNDIKTVGAKATLDFKLDQSTDSLVTYSRIESEIQTNTAGSEDGTMIFSTVNGGTLTEYLRIDGNADTIFVGANTTIQFADSGETIASNATDLTLTSGGDLNLNATDDVNLPDAVGLTFGIDANKIEAAGSVLTIGAGTTMNLNAVSVDVNATLGPINLDAQATSQYTTTIGDITIDAIAGSLFLDGDSTVTIDSNGGISLDGGAASNFNTSGELTLGGVGLNLQGGSGEIDMLTTGAIDINSGTGITVDSTSGAINIGTNSSGLPVFIGHNVSDVTINDDLIVLGDLTVMGTMTTVESETLVIQDNLLLVNGGPSGTSDGGILSKRYQTHNNASAGGDVVIDPPMETSTGHGGVSGAGTATSITLNAGANAADNYYDGWWIVITSGAASGNVRRIKDYNGTTKVADIYSAADEIAIPQTPPTGADFTSGPSGASYNLHDCAYATMFYDESANEWVAGCTSSDPGTGAVQITKYVNLHVNTLVTEGASSSAGGTFDGAVIIDETDSEVFLVRKDVDSGDVFRIDTVTPKTVLINPSSTINDETVLDMSLINASTTEYIYSQIASKIKVNTASAEESQLILRVSEGGALYDYVVIDGQAGSVNLEKKSIIDVTDTEALLVRKEIDGGDVFTVDTMDSTVRIGAGSPIASTAKLSIYGTTVSTTDGPHYSATTTEDIYPVFQQLNWSHDNISLNFDCYNDGTWRSADPGSNFQIYKYQDKLRFNYDTGKAAGTASTLAANTALDINTSGDLTFYSNIKFSLDGAFINADTSDGADNKHLIISGGGGTDATRGGHIELYGNEHVNAGDLILESGDNSSSTIHLRTNGSDKLSVLNGGTIQVNPKSQSGSPGLTGSSFTVGSETFTDSATATSGTTPNHNFNTFSAPTLAATNVGVSTTEAATVYIANAPIAGTNMSITNAYALWVDSGEARFDGNVKVNGTLETSSLSFDGQLIVDENNTEALLVRKDGDLGDVFSVDTVNSRVTMNNTLQFTPTGTPLIDMKSNGAVAPTFNSRSGGTKIVLWDSLNATNVDYAVGIEGGSLWNSIPQANNGVSFKWYGGITQIMELEGDGSLTLEGHEIIETNNTEALLVRKAGDAGDVLAVDTINEKVTVSGGLYGLESAPTITVSTSNLVNISTSLNVTVRNAKLVKHGDDRTLFASFEILPIAGTSNTEFRFEPPDLTTVTNTYDIICSVQGWLISTEDNLENMLCLGATSSNDCKIKFTSVNSSAHMVQVVIKYTSN